MGLNWKKMQFYVNFAKFPPTRNQTQCRAIVLQILLNHRYLKHMSLQIKKGKMKRLMLTIDTLKILRMHRKSQWCYVY